MLKMSVPVEWRRNRRLASFTLIELLTVMAIIAILAALILSVSSGVFTKAARSRAASEIQAMSTALESYKADNGIYPSTSALTTFTTNAYSTTDVSSAGGIYQQSSQVLYQALSGQVNFQDTPVAGTKAYMSFKANQLGNTTTAAGTASSANTATYVKDPWGYSYGYSTTTNGAVGPYNGSGFFDLWSTGGLKGTTAANTNTWLSNWQ